ncbi:hypothetical protein D3C86_1657700 [compost metagenome]
MVLNFNSEDFFDGRFDTLNSWITKLDHFSRIRENNVVMLLGSVGFFKLCEIFTELVFTHQVTRQQ